MLIDAILHFLNICRLIDSVGKAKRSDAPDIELAALKWGKAFLKCGESGMRGFQPKNVPPYAHALMTHVALQVKTFGPMKLYNGQSLENNTM